jgi:hypothetical protein
MTPFKTAMAIQARYARLKRKHGHKKAVVATGHHLLTIAFDLMGTSPVRRSEDLLVEDQTQYLLNSCSMSLPSPELLISCSTGRRDGTGAHHGRWWDARPH